MKTTRSRLRLLAAALLATALSLTLVAPAEAKHRHAYPDEIALPNGFQPEGITIGKRPIAYLGSLADGDIYAADLRTGEGKVVVEGRRHAVGRPEALRRRPHALRRRRHRPAPPGSSTCAPAISPVRR